MIFVKVLAPGFYARQNIKTPVKIAIVTLIATQIMNLIFIWHLKHAGLALAIALGACLNAGLLYTYLRKHGIYQLQPGWGIFAFKVGVAIYFMAAVLWVTSGGDQAWLLTSSLSRAAKLMWIVVLGAICYFAALWLMGFRLKDFAKRAA
jgi:putative peptidoglycan lipid II flippase